MLNALLSVGLLLEFVEELDRHLATSDTHYMDSVWSRLECIDKDFCDPAINDVFV